MSGWPLQLTTTIKSVLKFNIKTVKLGRSSTQLKKLLQLSTVTTSVLNLKLKLSQLRISSIISHLFHDKGN